MNNQPTFMNAFEAFLAQDKPKNEDPDISEGKHMFHNLREIN